jgi:hypothetical protein
LLRGGANAVWRGGMVFCCAMQRISILAVLLCFCGLVMAQDSDRSHAIGALKGEYSSARAMELMYGSYDADTKSSVWTPAQGPNYGARWPDLLRVHVLTDETYSDGGVPRHVLVTWGKPEESGAGEYSCHACGVLIGVSVLRKDGKEWKVESSDLQLALIGAFGRPPQAKVQRLGEHTWGVVAQMGDMHQGQPEQAMWIYGPKAGGFTEWFKTDLIDDGKYGEFPQDDWCKDRAGEMDVICVWRQIDYAMQPAPGKEIYDMVKTRRTPKAVGMWVWRFNGERFMKSTQPQTMTGKP